MADPTNPVGVLGNNSNLAPSPAESGVTNNPSAVMPSGAGQAQGSTQSPTPGPASASITINSGDPDAIALLGASDTVTALKANIASALDPPAAGTAPHVGRSNETVLGAMDQTVVILRLRPDLALGVDPTELAANADKIRAGIALANTLKVLLTEVEGTNLARVEPGWADVRSVYRTAKGEAPGDATLAQAIVPIAGLFPRTKRDLSAVQIAAAAALQAANANVKSTKANAKVTTARARANALAPQLATTGTGDAIITEPAPSAPSTTTPSAAAPGVTPGTPGSTTIR